MSNLEGDDIPPLEDMTEYVENLKMKESAQNKRVTSSDSSLLTLEEGDRPRVANPELLVLNKKDAIEKDIPSTTTTSCSRGWGDSKTQQQTSTDGAGFGGMKKGFLSGSKGQKKRSSKPTPPSNNIPFVQSKQQDTDNLRFKEVQDELKKTHPLLVTKDWLTEDLLTKISSNPVLSKAFSDPKLFQVLEEFQKNPQQALMAAKHDPVVTEFLQQFCSVMGDHFNTMADLQERQQGVQQPTEAKQLSEDEKSVQDLLNNPQVKAALLDPDIIKLMELLKSDPNEAQRFLNTIQFKPDIRSKLTTLIENKLLSIQNT